jgi:hypothetical protein
LEDFEERRSKLAVVNPVAITARQSRSFGEGLVVVKLPNR